MLESDNVQTGSERRRADILAAVSFASNSFLKSGNWRNSLDSSLRALGEATGANRAYLFENTTTEDGIVLASQTAEWAAPGIEPQINNQDLQQVPYVVAGMGRWLEQLEKGHPIYGSVADFPRSEQPLLESQDIRSIVAMPVHCANTLAGFLGFDDCEQQRAWKESEFNALYAAASALGAAMEREQLEQQLRFAQKMEAIGGLASGVAHEFNNMLQAIVGLTNLVKLKLKTGQSVDAELDEILAANDRAKTLTRELLLFARKQNFQQSTVDLGRVCESVATMVQPVLGSSVTFSMSVADPSPLVVADAGMIAQALMNLCLNGRDAMGNSGELTLTCETVVLEREVGEHGNSPASGDHACVTVTDTGCGMSDDLRERIFEPFFTTKDTGAGTGLGLSVVFGVVTESGGFIEVESTPGEGSAFKIFLPVTERCIPFDGHSPDDAALTGRTLLVVDDEKMVLDALRRLLEKKGYQVLSAATAEGACDLLKKHAMEIDAVLTDWSMPQMRGDEVIALATKLNPRIKSILLSGYFSDEIPLASDADAVLVLQKPVRFEELQHALTQILIDD